MNNILIIRSCNMAVFHDLMDNIDDKILSNNIYCFTQKNSVSTLKIKYPYLNFIIKGNDVFNYNRLKNNKELIKQINNIKFDEIYIPSSCANFIDFEQVFMIASKITSNKNILFNVNCEKKIVSLNFWSIKLKNIIRHISYFIQIPIAVLCIALIYIIMYPYKYIKKYVNKFFKIKNIYK